jgi:hypothetical protein
MLPLGIVPMRTQLSYVVSTKLGTQLLAHERAAIGVARQGLVLSLLGQRLCRILEAASAASSSREPPSVAQFAAAKLSPSARMARWKIMVVELFWVLRNFELKCCSGSSGAERLPPDLPADRVHQGAGKGHSSEDHRRSSCGKTPSAGTGDGQCRSSHAPALEGEHEHKSKQEGGVVDLCDVPVALGASDGGRAHSNGEPSDQETAFFGKYARVTLLAIYQTDSHYCL